jgi:hypothetical protein
VSGAYYYLVASLPSLVFSAPAGLARTEFVDECRRHLAPEDQRELEALLAGKREDIQTRFSRAWIDSDRQMRNAIVRARALRLGVDEKKFIKDHGGFRVDIEASVNDAFSRANPLERELALDRFRWYLADELSTGDAFGLPMILAYGVKLVINERWQALTPEKGKESLEELVGVVGVSSEEAAGWGGLAQL